MPHIQEFYTWDSVKSPIGIVIIIPGMCECVKQYYDFAKFLNRNRYIVVGIHDITAPTFSTAVRDIKRVICELKDKYNLPVFVFGHGYGAFIARRMLMMRDLCSGGVCLSGISKYPRVALRIAKHAAQIGIKIFGKNALAPRYHSCRKTYNFYHDMLDSIIKLSSRVPANIPILIINNNRGLTGRMTSALYNNYRENEMHNLTLILYPYGGNNLVLGNEGDAVQKDILYFLNSVK